MRTTARIRDGHSSGTPVTRRLQQPTRTARSDTIPKRFALTREALAPSLFGLAPGGVCRAAGVAAGAVRSYRTVSPLPRSYATLRGGLFSVALSLGSRPPDVIRHRVSLEPGLSSPATFRFRPERPPGRLTREGWGCWLSPSRAGIYGWLYDAMTSRSNVMARAAMVRGRPRWASRSFSVLRVDKSQTPSTRSGRK